ncbi:E3 ubiquitin-protein ligase TRAIP-like [Adelges cooleyi]|uniref:E3 ubiquitin-protein ligase TRAIP-like n=1 Tax=Adelges cooleyi TaxID=133065 RepID=UPI00217F9769|nr:E3 ubiquitin-protein ligase TRAIP-like [Adelges cooleyi]XP_050425408.1 E3 ubiquitin-protein ligase TRAIP-like [Adelges cooleyi]
MLASCSICGDVFTGIHPETVHSTPCGHIFHHQCLMQWLQRAQTCPHCRSRVSEKQVIKLYFHNNSNLSIKEDVSTLTHQVQSLSFTLTVKEQELKNLRQDSKKEKEQLATLKKHIKDVEDKVRSHQTVVSSLQENIRFLKAECKKSTCYKLEADDLRKELEKFESINSVLYGTPADSQEAVCLLKQKTDIQTLCLLITTFKREILTLKESNRDLENKLLQRQTKYMTLKKQFYEINSKESMNERVMDKLKSEVTDLEAEITRLQKKCGHLESMIHNGETPRRTELRRRFIHESPAPEITITPVADKLQNEDVNSLHSPQNSTSCSIQPKGQLKPQNLYNQSDDLPQNVNTFMPKSPRRPSGFMRPPLTTKSVVANYVSKTIAPSSSSDEEIYDGLGGRSKPDIFPNRQKPLLKKRKLVSNFKKKLQPSSGNTTLDSFLSSEIP